MLPKLAPYRRIREHYNPTMTAAEVRHREYVREQPCFGCGALADHAHHTLLKWPGKRWRRDHRCLLPVCLGCHSSIHDYFGDEELWLADVNRGRSDAIFEMERLWAESQLIEAMSGRGAGR